MPKLDEEEFQKFLKETTDALDDHSGGCIEKMINAFAKRGFVFDSFDNEAGGKTLHVDGDQPLPSCFFKDDDKK